MSDQSELTIAEMEKKLKTAQNTQITVTAIFALIVLAWIILGYWRTNVPVFISTIALAITTFVVTGAGPRKLAADIEKRKQEQT